MNKTIRVIDLLNKIANGEEAPKKIKFEGVDFNLEEETYYAPNTMYSLIDYIKLKRLNLNEELEIIEEQEEIDIQEIEELENWYVDKKEEYREFDIYAINLCFKKHQEKINELVQAVKQLDNK